MILLLRRYAAPLAILLTLAAVWWWHRGQVRAADEAGYQRAVGDIAARVAKANAEQDKRDSAARKAFQAKEQKWIGERSEYESQIAELRRRPAVVRVQRIPASADEVSRAAATACQSGGAGQPGVDTLQVGEDIGAEADELFAECEGYRRRLINLQPRWPQ